MDNKQYIDIILDQTKDLIWMVDHQLYLVYANKAYFNLMKEVTGVEKELNTPILMEGFGEGYMEKWKAYYQRALSGEDFTIEEHFFHPGNNEMQYGHISFSPIKGEDGKVQSVACRNTDVTSVVKEKYHASSLMDASLDVFCTINEAGNFVYVSEAAAAHWGYTPNELINTPYFKLVLREDITKTNNIADAIVAGEEVKSFINRYKRKDGSIAYNLWSARWDDEAKLMYCVARDVKEKIKEEHRLKLLSSVITNTNDAVLITEAEPVDEPGPQIIYVNEAFTRMTGYTAEEVLGKTPRILQGPKSDKEALAKLGDALRNWQPYEITTINYKKNGEEFWINFTVTPVANESGWYTHWIAIERDVTAQKNAELEKNLLAQISSCFRENNLDHAGKALCEIIRNFADFELVELWCPNLERTKMSRIALDTTLKAFRTEYESLSQLPITKGLPGKVWEQKKQLLWNESEIAENFVRKVNAQNEGLKHILGVPIIHNKVINGVLVIGTKKDAKQLGKVNGIIQNLKTFIGSEINRKRLESDLYHLHDSIPNLVSVGDLDGKFLQINKAGCDLLGYEEDEILNQRFEKFIHPDDLDDAFKEMARLQTEDRVLEIELRFLTKSGESLWLSWFCNAKVDEGLIYCTAKNITEEKKLKKLNSQAYDLAKVGSWEYDLIKNELFWSDEVFYLHDMDPGTFVPNVENAISFYKEEHKSYVAEEISRSLTEGVYLDYEAVIISKSKKEKWVRVIGSPEFIDGKCVKFIGSFQDTTDRREAESRLKNLSDNIPGVVFLYLLHPDGSDEFRYVSKGSEKIWGYSQEEVTANIDLAWSLVRAGGDYEAVRQSISDSVENKSQWSMRFRIVRTDGETRILQGFGTPEFLSDGSVVFNSVILDVTKEAKNEELLEQVSKLGEIGGWELNLITMEPHFSEQTFQIYELPPGKPPKVEDGINFYAKEAQPIINKSVAEAIENHTPYHLELPFITAKGKRIWVKTSGKVDVIDGKAVKLYGAIQDITDRKLAEIALRESETKFKTIFEIATLGIAQVDPSNGKIILANSYYETITGYTVDELLKMSFVELTHPDDSDEDWELFSKAAKGEGEYRNEKRYIKKDGTIVWVRLHVAFIRDENGKPTKTVAICEDITDRKEAEGRLQKLSDNIPGVVFQYFIHPDGTEEFKYVSKGAEKVWGYSSKEVTENLDLVWDQIKAGGDYEAMRQSIVDSIENKSKWSKRYRIVKPDGEKRIIQGFGTPEFLPDGTVVYSTVALDITEESKNEELLKLASELAEIGSWEVDIEKNTVFWSDEVHRMHETDPNSFVPDLESGINFYREDYREIVGQKVEHAISSGEDVEFEAVIVTQNLNERWVKAIGSCEMVDGMTKRFFGSFQDITERKTVELRLQSLSDDLPGVTFQYRVSPEGKDSRHFTSKAAHKIWGVSPEESERNTDVVWDQIKNGGDFEKVQESIEKSMKSGEKWHCQWRNLLPSGELRWHEGFGTPNYLPDGTIVFNSMIFDITERKQSEQQLLAINQKLETQTKELERSNEELEQFAYITSHDLQEPLRMVSSFMDQLDRKYADQLDGKAKKYIHFAKDGAKRMKQIILDLLLYSRVNRPTEQKEPVNLNEIISEFLLLRRKLIAEKKAIVHYDQLPTLETYIAPVTQLFHTLLDNALKYTKEHVSPIIQIEVVDKGKYWKFAVKDNGIGIDERFYDKVFIIFQRLHNRHEFDGTGIGLSIAKRVINFLGGEIWVESTVGEGSTFYFTISKEINQKS